MWHFLRVRCWASRCTNCSIWLTLATVAIKFIQMLLRANRRQPDVARLVKIVCIKHILPLQSIARNLCPSSTVPVMIILGILTIPTTVLSVRPFVYPRHQRTIVPFR
ncbi:MAG: hypothetical protein DWI00_16235 [Planctomycetota bacterium]|nr:MAG: hypothetical protein DWI00_16235 [Planctomycetota bacterium]